MKVLPDLPAILAQAAKDADIVFEHARKLSGRPSGDFEVPVVTVTVGMACDSGVNENQQFEVDITTGLHFIAAAREIIRHHRREVAPPEVAPPELVVVGPKAMAKRSMAKRARRK